MEGDTHKRGPEGQKEEDTKGEQSRGQPQPKPEGLGEERVAGTDELKERRRLRRQKRGQEGAVPQYLGNLLLTFGFVL